MGKQGMPRLAGRDRISWGMAGWSVPTSCSSTLPPICNQCGKLAWAEVREKAKEQPVNLVQLLEPWSLPAGGGGVESTAVQRGALRPSSTMPAPLYSQVSQGMRGVCTSCVGLPKGETRK